jgi:hypothetical protein
MIRRTLPQRRAAETFDMRFWNHPFTVTVGFYADGTLGEVFIDGGKTGQDIQSAARDAAVLLSLALQHGVPLKQFATQLPAARRKSPRRFWARSSIPSHEFIFGRRLMGVDREDFSDTANWQTPQELPDLRRVGIVALDTETRDEGLPKPNKREGDRMSINTGANGHA